MRTLVWLRADLRTLDNPALHAACAESDKGVVSVFTICPAQWREHDWADIKVAYILRNLASLREDLESLSIPLKILTFPRFDEAPAQLLTLASSLKCDTLRFSDEYEWNERVRDEAVETAFIDAGLRVIRTHDRAHFTPGSLRTGAGRYYSVYSPFRKAWRAAYSDSSETEPLGKPRKVAEMVAPSSRTPTQVEGFDITKDRPDLWPAGEDAAHKRLRLFCKSKLGAYADKRDLPGEPGVSVLSPQLTLGVLSPRQCIHAAREANGGAYDKGDKSAVKWIDEIIWREFYQHILVGFPWVNKGRSFKPVFDRIEWNTDDGTLLDAWKQGQTGYPIVDAGMRQLAQTGWMHNRVRMITAMFLTKDLFLDWRLGEAHFMRHLIDGDLGSNNGGWQWSASTGADGAPYFRIFNPTSQSRRCDPDGKYIRRFVPELADLDSDEIHDPTPIARDRLGYPAPIVDHAKARDHAIATFKAISDMGEAVEI